MLKLLINWKVLSNFQKEMKNSVYFVRLNQLNH